VLKDVSLQAAEKGKDYSRQLAEKKIQKGGDPNKYQNLLQRIVTTDDTALFAQCDLVIEAVFENRALKAQVTNEVEAVIPPQAVFASNTSTLPITGLAQASSRPHQFIGIHFFSPVDKMPLVEIIVGKQTNSSTLATAIDLALRLRKTPIVVNDSRGFFTSRVFATYTNEGMELLREGIPPARIENVAKASGMPVGPLAVTDEVNLALAYKILRQTEQDLGIPNQTATAFVTELFVNQLNRPGKKEGKGFYEYPANAKKYLWEGLQTHFPPVATSPDDATVRKRLLHIQALETYRCLAEGVLRSFTDGDIGSILGFGFPPYTGGALSYIDYIGIHTFIAECDHFAQQYGSRFEVPHSLRQLANQQGWAFVPPLVVLNA
jgi:3-hydroxyacyl-CoA dehydrogenase/enoyl-CoA hydratase/3-hydroxybutyryl-CoA epimerase